MEVRAMTICLSWRRAAASLLLACAVLMAGALSGAEGGASEHAPATSAAKASPKGPKVVLTTSMGVIKLQLDSRKAPLSTRNFLRYVDEGAYDGTIFHRVIPGFMIQGGGFTPDMQQRPTHSPVKNEAGNGLRNRRGSIAMARTSAVDSATSQFFINVADNTPLDHTSDAPRGFGYAVFGHVIEGMDVVDAIVGTPTTTRGRYRNVPVKPVILQSVKRELAK